MGRGSRKVVVRVSVATYRSVLDDLAKAMLSHATTAGNVSEWVREAILEKLHHRDRSTRRQRSSTREAKRQAISLRRECIGGDHDNTAD